MHVRRGRYIGVAPLPGGLANVCLVKPSRAGDPALRDPAALLACGARARSAAARSVRGARGWWRRRSCSVRSPSTSRDEAIDGLLLAGDAAGFIDPMTGDGLRFAVRGGELAASAALDALEHGWSGVHARLADARRREFAPKWRFNRALRTLVSSPHLLDLAAFTARIAPAALRATIARAGDC